jgi:hypothetical protein
VGKTFLKGDWNFEYSVWARFKSNSELIGALAWFVSLADSAAEVGTSRDLATLRTTSPEPSRWLRLSDEFLFLCKDISEPH